MNSESFGYNFINHSINILEPLILNIHNVIFDGLYFLIYSAVLSAIVIFGFKISFNRIPNIIPTLVSILFIGIFTQFFIKEDFYINFVYEPLLALTIGIMDKISLLNNIEGGIFGAVSNIDLLTSRIMSIAKEISGESNLEFRIDNFLAAKSLQVIYFINYSMIIFVVFFPFLLIHLLMAIIPILLIFAIFPRLNYIILNIVLLVIYSVIMSIFSVIIVLFFYELLQNILTQEISSKLFIQLMVTAFLIFFSIITINIISYKIVK